MSMPPIVHDAMVISCSNSGSELRVRFSPGPDGGCAGCALASSGCSAGNGGRDTKGEIELTARWDGPGDPPIAGDTVRITPRRGSTSRAATLLLTLPLAGMLAGAIVGNALGWSDGACALLALGATLLGFLPAMLAGRREKIQWIAFEFSQT